MDILVTGGTVFVSKYIANYFLNRGHNVTVLNRGNYQQVCGVEFIKKDRNDINNIFEHRAFDVVIDITAYNQKDVSDLLDSVGYINKYILLSSSAVYSNTGSLPFYENSQVGYNSYWQGYGLGKIQAESYLMSHHSNYYIIRPPYLYGPEENLYRELFCFDCALSNRIFYLPPNYNLQLQFFHVNDLGRIIETIIYNCLDDRIINVGNYETISIIDWVKLCYEVTGCTPKFKVVSEKYDQNKYFCFRDYEYRLDVSKQKEFIHETQSLKEGLAGTFEWYLSNKYNKTIKKKAYYKYIDEIINIDRGYIDI